MGLKMSFYINTVRLYPNFTQTQRMQQFGGACRWLWNWGLETRKKRAEMKLSTGPYDLINTMVALKHTEEYSWLKEIHSQVLQGALIRQTKSFSMFYKRKGGYPRFKKYGGRDSFTYSQDVKIIGFNRIKLPKIGEIKMRGLMVSKTGTLKSVVVEKIGARWFAHLMIDRTESTTLNNTNKGIIGIDLGVTHLATVHDGEKAVHYHHNTEAIKKSEERIKLYQRKLSRCEKGSKNRDKWRIKLQKEYEHLRNIRKDTLHKLGRKLVNDNSLIVLETLQVTNMTKSASGTKEKPGKNVAQKRGLNRSIQRQGWGIFVRMLGYKAQQTGTKIALVDPKYTSQTCPKCKHRVAENRLTQAKFVCVNCGYADNADAVAAFNIRAIGLLSSG